MAANLGTAPTFQNVPSGSNAMLSRIKQLAADYSIGGGIRGN